MLFLHTSTWREFQESVGNKTFSLDEKSYLIKLDLPFDKSFLYSPSPDSYKYLDTIKKIAKKEGAVFFKFEPMIPVKRAGAELTREKLASFGFVQAFKPFQPQKTLILDLNKSEEVLLSEMHKKTRYNVRLAEKRGVEVKESEDIKNFWKLLKSTAQRDGFNTHQKEYYEKLLKLDNVKLFYATRPGKKEGWHSAALVIFDNKHATYLHGASTHKYRKHMGAQLLHWHIAKHAKGKNFQGYDFWGIDEERWPGITRFKKGFGGEEVEYMGSYDLPMQKIWYAGYKIKKMLRVPTLKL